MSELIFGNTGTKDEYINIDMELSLFNDLKRIIPKFRNHVNAAMKNDENIFVYLGMRNNHTIYGYHAKLISDSRGGNYGHYIAIPSNGVALFNLNDANFITEADFINFVSTRDLSNSKRFRVVPKETLITDDTLKAIVHELLCRFSQDNFKNTSIAFKLPDGSDYISNVMYVLDRIFGYLPYGLRNKIAAMSKIDVHNPVPSEIKIIACPNSQDAADSFDLTSTTAYATEGAFNNYITRIFSLSEEKRVDYFKWVHKHIEQITLQEHDDIYSETYLLHLQILDFRSTEDIRSVLDFVFGGNLDMIVRYPEHRKIVISCLEDRYEEILQYLSYQVDNTSQLNTIKTLYLDAKILFELIEIDFNGIIELFRARLMQLCVGVQAIGYLTAMHAADKGTLVDISFADSVIFNIVEKCYDFSDFVTMAGDIIALYRGVHFDFSSVQRVLMEKSGQFIGVCSEANMVTYFNQLNSINLVNHSSFINRAQALFAQKSSIFEISYYYKELCDLYQTQPNNLVLLSDAAQHTVDDIIRRHNIMNSNNVCDSILLLKRLYQGIFLGEKSSPFVQRYEYYLRCLESNQLKQKADAQRKLLNNRNVSLSSIDCRMENLRIFSQHMIELSQMEKSQETERYYASLCEKILSTIKNGCNYLALQDFIDDMAAIDSFVSAPVHNSSGRASSILRFQTIYRSATDLLACQNVSSLIDVCQTMEFKQYLRSESKDDVRKVSIIIFSTYIKRDKKFNYRRAMKNLDRSDPVRHILQNSTSDKLKNKSNLEKQYIFAAIAGILLIAAIVFAVIMLFVVKSDDEDDPSTVTDAPETQYAENDMPNIPERGDTYNTRVMDTQQEDPLDIDTQEDDALAVGGQEEAPLDTDAQQEDPLDIDAQEDDALAVGGQEEDPLDTDTQEEDTLDVADQEEGTLDVTAPEDIQTPDAITQ